MVKYGNSKVKLEKCKSYYNILWSLHFWENFVLVFENKIDWCGLSSNSNIIWDIVKKNPNKPWNWRALSRNQNITLDIVQDNLDKPWNWSSLMLHPNINWNVLQKYFNKYNNQNQLSYYNPITYKSTINLGIIGDEYNKPVNYYMLSFDSNITWKNLMINIDKEWCWSQLSVNDFKKEKEMFMERKMREHMMAFRIQTRWRKANYDPEYELCKRRIKWECKMFGFK